MKNQDLINNKNRIKKLNEMIMQYSIRKVADKENFYFRYTGIVRV